MLGLSALAGSSFTACAVYGAACTGPSKPTCRSEDLLGACNDTDVCSRTPKPTGPTGSFSSTDSTLTIDLAKLDGLEAVDLAGLDLLQLRASSNEPISEAQVIVSGDGSPLECSGTSSSAEERSIECAVGPGIESLSIEVAHDFVGTVQLEATLTESKCTGPEAPTCP